MERGGSMTARRQKAEYVAAVATELADIAASANFDVLVYLFRMAEREALEMLKTDVGRS